MALLDAIFGTSPRRSRRTTKKLNRATRVNINQRSTSVTLGGKRARATVGRNGASVTILGFKLF